jgi:hypothetical protein
MVSTVFDSVEVLVYTPVVEILYSFPFTSFSGDDVKERFELLYNRVSTSLFNCISVCRLIGTKFLHIMILNVIRNCYDYYNGKNHQSELVKIISKIICEWIQQAFHLNSFRVFIQFSISSSVCQGIFF